jgi:NADPH:quinone reductase-like Zn-dependent oxidoreductase
MPHQATTDATMTAVVTTGHGGYDKLEVREVPVPEPGPGEALLRVLAAGVNNTDINTRIGWYASSVGEGTNDAEEEAAGRDDGGWSGATPFPLIQGTDCCGRIVAVGPGSDASRIGARALVRSCMRRHGFDRLETVWLGTDLDGAFAQYVVVPDREVFTVDCDWSDAELATLPCAYGTAENMVQRAGVREGTRVLVPGASGGVGSAVVQLARRRGAEVVGIASEGKRDAVRALGAEPVLAREDDVLDALGADSVDVVVDNVAGPSFPALLEVLRRGGRYVSSGAIAGPKVQLDLRTVYLNDLALIGCTAWDEGVFGHLVSYVERGQLQPLLERTFPLERIAEAQRVFQEKRHVGKLVLIPPA